MHFQHAGFIMGESMNDSEARPRFRKRWGGRCFPAVLLCIFCSLQTRLDSAQCNDLIWANEASKKPVYNNGIFTKAMTYPEFCEQKRCKTRQLQAVAQ
jgi:hypothetical protein